VSEDGRFNNYHLGGFVILVGCLFFGCNGPVHLGRRGIDADPRLIAWGVVALGVWTIIREYRRRRRDGR